MNSPFPKDQKAEIVASLRRYFTENLDSNLSEMQAGLPDGIAPVVRLGQRPGGGNVERKLPHPGCAGTVAAPVLPGDGLAGRGDRAGSAGKPVLHEDGDPGTGLRERSGTAESQGGRGGWRLKVSNQPCLPRYGSSPQITWSLSWQLSYASRPDSPLRSATPTLMPTARERWQLETQRRSPR